MNLNDIVAQMKLECPNLHFPTGLCFQLGYICPFYETLLEHKAPNCDIWKGIKLREEDTYIKPELFDMAQMEEPKEPEQPRYWGGAEL